MAAPETLTSRVILTGKCFTGSGHARSVNAGTGNRMILRRQDTYVSLNRTGETFVEKSMSIDLQSLTHAALPELSPQLRIAARYVLANEAEAAMASMRTIAARAGVQPATMVRLARKLGFGDWNELRDALQEKLLQRPEGPIAQRARNLVSRGDAGRTQSILDELLKLEEINLRSTWQEMDLARLETAVEMMRSARRVFFLGRRSCYPVAFSLHYSFGMIRDNGHLVTDGGAGIGNSFAALKAEDLVIGIGFTPYSRETVELMQLASESGARTVVITDTSVSALAQTATLLFVVSNESPTLFQSIVAAQALGQAFIALLTAADGQTAVDTLNQREARLKRFRAYWEDDHKKAKSKKGE